MRGLQRRPLLAQHPLGLPSGRRLVQTKRWRTYGGGMSCEIARSFRLRGFASRAEAELADGTRPRKTPLTPISRGAARASEGKLITSRHALTVNSILRSGEEL